MAPKKGGKSARAAPGSAAKPAGEAKPPAPTEAKPQPAAAPKSKASPPPPVATPAKPAALTKEEPFAPATILLLGGYGTVGSAISRTLLEQSSTVTVLVAGRTSDKAALLCKQLNAEFPAKGEPRAKPLTADAADSSTLAGCPRFDVVVNATTMRQVEGVITLMRFAASKRSSYLDLRGPIGLESAVAKAVGDVSPVVLMGGGYCPGALAPFLKMAVNKLANCSSAHLSIAATALPSQAEEAIEAMMCGTRLEAWSNGKWAPAKPSEAQFARAVDFGDGKVHCPPYSPWIISSPHLATRRRMSSAALLPSRPFLTSLCRVPGASHDACGCVGGAGAAE